MRLTNSFGTTAFASGETAEFLKANGWTPVETPKPEPVEAEVKRPARRRKADNGVDNDA